MNDELEVEEFEALIERFDHAMLVCVAADHNLHARPMAIAGHDGPLLRFATSRQSTKAAEVVHRPRVAVVMQGGGAYLTLGSRGHPPPGILLGNRQGVGPRQRGG